MSKSLETTLSRGENWGGYWTFITATMLIMLALYLAGNGLLTSWLKLFIYSTPQSVQPSSNSGLSTGGAVQAGAAGAAVAGIAGAAGADPATASQAGQAAAVVTGGASILGPGGFLKLPFAIPKIFGGFK